MRCKVVAYPHAMSLPQGLRCVATLCPVCYVCLHVYIACLSLLHVSSSSLSIYTRVPETLNIAPKVMALICHTVILS